MVDNCVEVLFAISEVVFGGREYANSELHESGYEIFFA